MVLFRSLLSLLARTQVTQVLLSTQGADEELLSSNALGGMAGTQSCRTDWSTKRMLILAWSRILLGGPWRVEDPFAGVFQRDAEGLPRFDLE